MQSPAQLQLSCAQLVQAYVDEIWNRQRFDRLNDYLAEDVLDHGLPASLPKGSRGVQAWIAATNATFEQQLIIEDQVTDEQAGKSVIRVTHHMKHVAEWRGIPATGKTVNVPGYRLFRIENGRIVELWAQIDGDHLERALRAA